MRGIKVMSILGLLGIRASCWAAMPLIVTFEGQTAEHRWALREIDPSLPSDWSDYEYLVLEMRASSSQRFELRIHTKEGVRAQRIHPFAGVWIRAAVPLRYYKRPDQQGHDLASLHNKPRLSFWINVSGAVGPLQSVEAIGVAMQYPIGRPTLEIRSMKLTKEDPGDAVLDKLPVVDEFGQWIPLDWPGKVRTLDELRGRWAEEERKLSPGDFGYCQFGGYRHTRARASGFFRVEQIEGRWWFVDPDGHLFFSTGIDVITPYSGTRVEGREQIFAALPPADLSAGLRGRPSPQRMVSFYTWNLFRRFGEDWPSKWIDMVFRRMAAWGFNTVGNWSDPRLAEARRVPYVVTLRGWGIEQGPLGMPDVYSPDWVKQVDQAAREQCAPRRDDPYVLGYFVANEPPWPGREPMLAQMILEGPPTGIQKELKAFLAEADTPERRRQFIHRSFERMLEVIVGAIRKYDPNHLILGIRFGGRPPEEVLRAARIFDVNSQNIYDYVPDRSMLDRVYELTGRPIVIGEFHFGVPTRGLAPGLRQVRDQRERGVAYRYYVEQAAAHPALVGTHWFQWVDQPVTGRMDGENYNIGLVDVTDLPYNELIEAAKETHRRLWAVHAGKESAFNQRPQIQ